MIDVHLLIMPGERADWRKQCLASLRGEPAQVRVIPGKVDDLGGARAEAFLEGTSPYVSWVDPDDYVLPGGFQACIHVMKQDNSVAACTQEYVTGISGKIIDVTQPKDWIHHLIVLKRDIAIKHLSVLRNWDHKSSQISEGRYFIEFLLSHQYPVSFVKQPYYVWRRHSKADSVRRRTHG